MQKGLPKKSMMLEGFLLEEIKQKRVSFNPVPLEQKGAFAWALPSKSFWRYELSRAAFATNSRLGFRYH